VKHIRLIYQAIPRFSDAQLVGKIDRLFYLLTDHQKGLPFAFFALPYIHSHSILRAIAPFGVTK